MPHTGKKSVASKSSHLVLVNLIYAKADYAGKNIQLSVFFMFDFMYYFVIWHLCTLFFYIYIVLIMVWFFFVIFPQKLRKNQINFFIIEFSKILFNFENFIYSNVFLFDYFANLQKVIAVGKDKHSNESSRKGVWGDFMHFPKGLYFLASGCGRDYSIY